MGRKCKICTHPDREEIEECLARSVSYRKILKRYFVTITSISRHRQTHMQHSLESKIELVEPDRTGSGQDGTDTFRAALAWILEHQPRIDGTGRKGVTVGDIVARTGLAPARVKELLTAAGYERIEIGANLPPGAAGRLPPVWFLPDSGF